VRPSLPPLPPLPPGEGEAEALRSATDRALRAAEEAGAELGALRDPSARVQQALAALDRARELLAGRGCPWPGDLSRIKLPARNGAAALRSDACDRYCEALAALAVHCERPYAARTRLALDQLLTAYGEHYATVKRQRSAVDFADLELIARDLLRRPEFAARVRERISHVLVDELQDTNRVQFELIDLVASDSLFMVGDALQSIYGFRHAEVELFEERGRALQGSGGRLSLNTNFRSRREILTVVNAAFVQLEGEHFRPLEAARDDPRAEQPLVELLIADKGADWESDGLAAPWRQAEARALASRVRQLIGDGVSASAIVVLTRASTDLRVYERALEEAAVPTYLIGGRGYWSHPQVVELVCYLRALANPCDEEALYATWYSPLCDLSLDAVLLMAAGAREELRDDDRERLERFEVWFAAERSVRELVGPEELLVRATERGGYVLSVLTLPGGRRRLANIRKLMRLAREWEAASGSDLHGFLELVAQRALQSARESEAPVEGEGLDAVRLMTIHRSKGLEFDVVCVADLGRGPTFRPELVHVSADGTRLGLRLAQPGTAARIPALEYDALAAEQAEAAAREERRLFYVAMTRARERLILSGAARRDTWAKGNQGTPIDWIAPALVPGIDTDQASRVTELGVRLTFLDADLDDRMAAIRTFDRPRQAETDPAPLPELPPAPDLAPARRALHSLSYSSLAQHERCGYRFYVERLLGVPPFGAGGRGEAWAPAEPAPWSQDDATARRSGAARRLGGAERGTLVHAILERIDFRRPEPSEAARLKGVPASEATAVGEMIERFAASATCARLARADDVRREQPFALALGEGVPLLTGTVDVLAREATGGLLVVDYKSDELAGVDPQLLVERRYALQQEIYALAALRTDAHVVEVVHLFLERPEAPCARVFTPADVAPLERGLRARAAAIIRGEFPVAAEPHAALCAGCPAEGGLCSWPTALTRRQAADRLF
jgi:ATP-dependent exoDNAse (exonuclease V) beta subunit